MSSVRWPMQIEVLRSRAQLAALADDWAPLAMAAGSPLLEHDWMLTCAETLHDECDLRVITVRDQGRLVAVAPLAVERGDHATRLALLGATRLYEPGGWLWQSPDALHALIDGVRRVGPPLLLHRVAHDSSLPDALSRLQPSRAVVMRRETAPSLAVETQGRWDEYYASLSSTITGNLPRVRRRAERALGSMTVEHLQPAAAEVAPILEAFTAIEGSGWKSARGSALAHRPELRHFFEAYCRRLAARGQLRCARLAFGGVTAAMELAVEVYDRWWQLKIGYHAEASAYYPGLHLTQSAIQQSFLRHLRSYEFLGVAETWEERWRPVSRRYETIALYPLSPSGLMAVGGDVARRAWRRITAHEHRP